MNTIAALIRGQPDHAEEAVEDLSDLFRASLGDKNMVRLENEVELVKRYLHIEKLRLGERLDVKWDLDLVPMDARVPALLLQPLLENAIYHGIKNKPDSGHIQIIGKKKKSKIVIQVIDDGVGMSKKKVREIFESPIQSSEKSGIGVCNVRNRIKLYFGTEYDLKCYSSINQGTKIEIYLPQIRK